MQTWHAAPRRTVRLLTVAHLVRYHPVRIGYTILRAHIGVRKACLGADGASVLASWVCLISRMSSLVATNPGCTLLALGVRWQ